jgi:multiple antibiotic resistance protein
MTLTFLSYMHLIFLGFVSLFPPVNPFGTALIIEPFLTHLTSKERRWAATKIAFYCFSICVVSIFFGGVFFEFFGISIPVVQMAGGILICTMGWRALYADASSVDGGKDVVGKRPTSLATVKPLLFFPLAFPTTTGAGTISVLLTLSANSYHMDRFTHFMNLLVIVFAALLMCILVFISYYFAPTIIRKFGEQGREIMNRLSGFLMFCVGLQIFVNGIIGLVQILKTAS